jgi:hypothetical protein
MRLQVQLPDGSWPRGDPAARAARADGNGTKKALLLSLPSSLLRHHGSAAALMDTPQDKKGFLGGLGNIFGRDKDRDNNEPPRHPRGICGLNNLGSPSPLRAPALIVLGDAVQAIPAL